MFGPSSVESARPLLFISHDSSEEQLARELERALVHLSGDKIACFVSDNAHGRYVQQEVAGYVRTCAAFVCVVTRKSAGRTWVNYEIGLADALEKTVFFLVLDASATELASHPITGRRWASANRSDVVRLFKEILDSLDVAPVDDAALNDRASAFIRAILGGIEDVERSGRVEQQHIRHVQRIVDERARDARFELDQERRSREADYVARVTHEVRNLHGGDRLFAVCGDKDWNLDAWQLYLDENVEAARRGVVVHRVYVEPPPGRHPRGFSDDEWRVIIRHLECAKELPKTFKVSVLLADVAEEARDRHKLPAGFGLVIPCGARPMALIHFGMERGNRHARAFTESLVVDIYRRMHHDIASLASPRQDVERRMAGLSLG